MEYAVITGSTRGIGKAIAIDLLKRGCYVILNYFNSDEVAEKVRSELSCISTNFSIIKSDLSSFGGMRMFARRVRSITSSIKYIILNVGITKKKGFRETKENDWNKILCANLTIPFFIVQRLERSIKNHGRIVFIGSVLGQVPHAVSIPYGVSKAGLNMLAKYLVKEFSSRSITVNVVSPGFVNTSWHNSKNSAQIKRIKNSISLKRFAESEEISSTCMHVLDNGYINGQLICVDGGYNY